MLVLVIAACGDDPAYEFGIPTDEIQFEFFDVTEGIHPSTVTLINPRNPFRDIVISDDQKFAIQNSDSSAGAFDAWAALLANIPIGENQFFTAVSLRNIYESDELAEENREIVRQMAVDAFQSVLDCFPESVLFDSSGNSPRGSRHSRLCKSSTPGVPQGDWTLVEDTNGIHCGTEHGDPYAGSRRPTLLKQPRLIWAAGLLAFGLVGACTADLGTPDYSSQDGLREQVDGVIEPFPPIAPDPYQPGDERLSLGYFYKAAVRKRSRSTA